MRILLIMRGAPSSGKSTWIEKQGLMPYTLSSEQISLQFSNPTFKEDGGLSVNHHIKRQISDFIEAQLAQRLKRGETTLIDSQTNNREIMAWANMARAYQYKILVIDMNTDLETCLQRNETRRGSIAYLPPHVLTHSWNMLQNSRSELKKFLRFESAETFELNAEFSLNIQNLENYQKIIAVGDIHGCREHLHKLLSSGIEKHKFYIFVGDYLDRGYDNAGVMEWLWENCFENNLLKENVVLLAGNHERYLQAWLNNESVSNDEFTGRTRPELLKYGWNPSAPKFKIFLKALTSCFCYEFHGKKIFASHAGVPAPLQEIWRVSSLDFEKGWGNHVTDIDKIFSENMKGTNFYQIHGHRNAQDYPILATEHSINLAGKVEFGGELRGLCHTKDGFEAFSASVQMNSNQKTYQIVSVPEKVKALFKDPSCPHCDAAFFADLQKEKNVQVTPQKGWQHIVSLRLKKAHEKERITPLKPQGLFLNQKTNTILARSYNKFSKIGGKQSLEKIRNQFSYPVTARIKENGFLGLTGCDDEHHLLLASRNYLTGPFAESFTEKVDDTLGHKIFTLNEDFGVSCIFEVIDPVKFPNIIEYDQPALILLDVIYREEQFKKLPYEALEKIAEFLQVPYSKEIAVLHNDSEFMAFLKQAETQEHAGYIFEDQNHFIVKYRTPYYQAWTLMNGVLQTILEGRNKRFPSDLLRLYRKYPNYFTEERQILLRGFYDYLDHLPKNILAQGLIAVRKRYFDEA
ncbi:hypothetical protein FAI41_07105 [Acetobacteraceae bacterium]|nr:hypothetical protein FAI41_07105 [Acetobacteraceae bacterium]